MQIKFSVWNEGIKPLVCIITTEKAEQELKCEAWNSGCALIGHRVHRYFDTQNLIAKRVNYFWPSNKTTSMENYLQLNIGEIKYSRKVHHEIKSEKNRHIFQHIIHIFATLVFNVSCNVEISIHKRRSK